MDFYIIVSYFILWIVFMVSPAYICFKLPKSYFNPNSLLFKEKNFEKHGDFYEKVFLVHKWKWILPDGAAIWKNGFRKKHLKNISSEYLNEFIIESCKAEATHLPPMFLALLFALYNPPNVVLIMVIFGVITNLPCIITQRYNRIRIHKLLIRRTLICQTRNPNC